MVKLIWNSCIVKLGHNLGRPEMSQIPTMVVRHKETCNYIKLILMNCKSSQFKEHLRNMIDQSLPVVMKNRQQRSVQASGDDEPSCYKNAPTEKKEETVQKSTFLIKLIFGANPDCSRDFVFLFT